MTAVWSLVADPFQPAFMRRALIEVLVLAVPAGLVGSWIVARRMAFLSHALGHATFPALVVAYLAGWSIFGTALGATAVLALALGLLGTRRELADGVAVGVVLSAAVAMGAILVSDIADPGVGAESLLFGSLLAVSDADLWRSVAVAALALLVAGGLGRSLMAATFDRAQARAAGLPVAAHDAALLLLLAATVAVAVTIVGSLMLTGLLLIPAATARQLTRRLHTLQLAAVGIAAVEGVAGLWLAYRVNAPPGACIALLATGVLVLVGAGGAAARPLRRHAWG